MATQQVTGNNQEPTAARLRKQTATVAQDLRELGGLAEQAAVEKLQHAAGAVAHAYGTGQKRVVEGRDHLAELIRRRPLTSVLVVAGASYALGCWLRRRH